MEADNGLLNMATIRSAGDSPWIGLSLALSRYTFSTAFLWNSDNIGFGRIFERYDAQHANDQKQHVAGW